MLCQNTVLNLSELGHKNYVLVQCGIKPHLIVISLHNERQHMPVVSMRLKVGTQPSVSSKNSACMLLQKFRLSGASVSQAKL